MRSFRGSPSGNVVCRAAVVNVDPPSLNAVTMAYQNITVAGVQPGALASNVRQTCFVNPLTDISTLGYCFGAMPRVSAANTVRVANFNITAGALDPAALDVCIVILGDPNAD